MRIDAAAYLSIWLALLAGLSARQVLGVFGAIGSPALLFAAPLLVLWIAGWIIPDSGLDRRPHPLRPALLLYLWFMLLSYTVANARPLTELESSGSTRALIITVALVGVALVTADGVTSKERLERLLARLVIAVAFVSVIGIGQFLTGQALQLPVPGLEWNSELLITAGRSLFNRPTGTTLHPIEYSVVTAATLPLAIHFSLYSPRLSSRRNMTVVTALIAMGVPLSISRSGLLALVVGLLVAAFAWSWRRRANAALLTLGAVPILWMGVPGLVGTLIGLFTNLGTDISVQARLDRTPRIMALIRDQPWFGLGNGTWSVEQYFLVDNEVWVTTLETGIVGAIVTFGLFGLAIFLGVLLKHLPGVAESTGHLAHALAASITAIVVSFATFDAFHYRILTGMLFLLIGAVGALWRMTRHGTTPPVSTVDAASTTTLDNHQG